MLDLSCEMMCRLLTRTAGGEPILHPTDPVPSASPMPFALLALLLLALALSFRRGSKEA